MDSLGRDGDGRRLDLPPNRSYFAPADGYFTAQALRAGLLANRDVGRFGFVPPMFPMGSLQRAIEKERIREEILREMEEKRILEEEVRREMEAERMMSMRRAPMDFCHDRLMVKAHSEIMINEGYCRSQGITNTEAPCDVVQTPSVLPRAEVDKKSPLSPCHKLETKLSEASPFCEQVNEKILGTKRKAEAPATQTSKLTKKDWSCDLCQVNATCEQNLNNHFEGRKHKAKVEALKGSKTVVKTCGTNAKPKPNPAVVSNKEAEPKNAPKMINIQVDGKMYHVLRKKTNLWCQSCKFKCNSTIKMASHLGGKKHNAKMMELVKDKSTHETATPGCGEKVVEKFLAEERATLDSLEEGKVNEGNGAEEPAAEDSLEKEVKVKEECQAEEPVAQDSLEDGKVKDRKSGAA